MKRNEIDYIGTVIGIGNSLETPQNFLFFIKDNADIVIHMLLPGCLLF